MDSKINKADAELQKLISEKRIKDDDDKKVASEVFDDKTLKTLYKLANQNYLDILNGAISTGKEANVLKGIKDDGSIIAVKIYRITTSDFKKMHYYIDGDPRFNVKSTNKRQLIKAWVNKEYRNLNRLYENGVNVPKPIVALDNVLLLEFIGNDQGEPAKTARYDPPEDPTDFYERLLLEMDRFINKSNLIHGDLSTFNIMNFNQNPVIIDVSQSVVRDHPIAKELLLRDIKNISTEFNKLGVQTSESKIKDYLNLKI
ncbi:MAG: serine protein kinase RIO [Methanobacteriaceae archaeon]|jgi:RIO kinase 1|uniref:serine protein kinase RIO n=2 Tax=Methanobacteriaceae TaxID=2159 RepID=UPI002A0DF112|nr:serine protein kinase RIO [Methanobacteriaceae archaeon]MDD3408557.1 serine protein kinase RIO [Methanobacteriaceae archaeon]MDD4593490.1 serine protein kinase RIO [Methanobacteriaceae archaeon]